MTSSTMTMLMMLGLAPVVATGCTDLGSPATLDRARILAVRIDPPHVPAGSAATIDVLVGDASGRVSVVTPSTVTPLQPQLSATLVAGGTGGWSVQAPGETELAAIRTALQLAPSAPVPLGLDVEVVVDGEPLTAIKLADLGDQGANPTVAGVTLAGAEATGVAVVPIGDIDLAPVGAAGTGELTYAWYSSVGDLSRSTTEHAVLTAVEPRDGEILVVVRDAQLGVAWAATDVRIE